MIRCVAFTCFPVIRIYSSVNWIDPLRYTFAYFYRNLLLESDSRQFSGRFYRADRVARRSSFSRIVVENKLGESLETISRDKLKERKNLLRDIPLSLSVFLNEKPISLHACETLEKILEIILYVIHKRI